MPRGRRLHDHVVGQHHDDVREGRLSASADAVVVGSGPNGLVAAVLLARAGLGVTVYEAADAVGGGTRTRELTLPGFRHDVCSAVHPLGAGSPVLRRLPLAEHGLRWVRPELALAHPQPDAPAAVLASSREATADALGADGGRYRAWQRPFEGRWDDLAADALRPLTLPLPRHPVLLAQLGLRGLPPASLLAAGLTTARARSLLAGLAAHAMAPLRQPGTGAVALLLALAAHEVGWPSPAGGSQAIADALTGLLRSHGGEVVTDRAVTSLDELPRASAYLLDVAPSQLGTLAAHRLPEAYFRALRGHRAGPAAFKIDYALDGPVPWADPAARRAGTVHLGGSLAEIAAALEAVHRGRPPDAPFLIAAQPTVADPSRAPAGHHILWVYCHVPNGWDGDLSDAIERQLERFAPGFRDRVLARAVRGPAVIEADNRNNVGGDIGGGAFSGLQAFLRPVPALVPHATPDPAVFLCSAATPPGPGVHGMCGYHAARVALRRVFGRRLELGAVGALRG